MIDEAELDGLLAAELSPPEGSADMVFVARVDRTLAEAERYRAARAALTRQMGTEALAVGSVAASLGFLVQLPELNAALSAAPGLAWTALLALTLVWLLMMRSRLGAIG